MAEMLYGKKRSFARGLLLTIVTFGLYALYWHYNALKEMYDQEKRTDFPIVLYVLAVLPIVSVVGAILYMSNMLEFLNRLRVERGMDPIFGTGGFLAWYVLGVLIIIGPFVAYYRLQTAVNEYWDSVERSRALAPKAETPPMAPRAG